MNWNIESIELSSRRITGRGTSLAYRDFPEEGSEIPEHSYEHWDPEVYTFETDESATSVSLAALSMRRSLIACEDSRLRHEFDALRHEWKAGTKFTSSMSDMILNFAYQRIIGLGSSVVPLIIEELTNNPDHWFWALRAITGEDPVPESSAGNLRKMTQAWLQWARERGIIGA